MKPILITGNQNKADQFAKFLGLEFEHQKVNLEEIQSTSLREIVEHKVRQAYDVVKQPVIVEDVSLEFVALGKLPGTFIKFFEDAEDGQENLCRMLDGFEDRSAIGRCMFGYFDGQTVTTFEGEIHGVVAQHPKGSDGWGWDQIFCPEGYGGKTRAELSEEEYGKVYQIIKPFAALREFLSNSH